MEEILVGRKRYELRRRPPRIAEPMKALLYETTPNCQIRGRCVAGPVISASKDEIWRRVGIQSRLTRREFDLYFGSNLTAHAIALRDVHAFAPISLADLRERIGFVPPQAWGYASDRLLSYIGAEKC